MLIVIFALLCMSLIEHDTMSHESSLSQIHFFEADKLLILGIYKMIYLWGVEPDQPMSLILRIMIMPYFLRIPHRELFCTNCGEKQLEVMIFI